LRIGLKIAQ